MGSFYITISIPSAEHEKSLWIQNSLGKSADKNERRTAIRPNRSAELLEDYKSQNTHENLLRRSISVENLEKVNSTFDIKKIRVESVSPVRNNKNRTPMEERLENCLIQLNIPNAVWVLGRAGKLYQVSFCTPDAGENCEQIIQLLSENKIGVEFNSTVSILPCSLYYEGKGHPMSPTSSPNLPPASQACLGGVKEATAWEQFVGSVRARLMVEQVVAGVKNNAAFTFDFLVLLIIASLTAAVGLLENSVVILVASMLISPLMGPVMASTFGFVTKDWKLQKIGVLNELLGLLLCVVIGFLFGLSIGYFSWESSEIIWPTPEMLSRGDLRSLLMGALIALLSGAAVAIAVLGNYSSSLTGVAISASLMPPAVNAGLLWALAVVVIVLGPSKAETLTAMASKEPVWDLLVLGALSLALTFINIVCIFIVGILVLKIKEVTPRGSKDYSTLLWKETIQIARDYNKQPQPAEGMEQEAAANQFPDVFNHTHRLCLNTWTAMQDLNRPSIHTLASAWQHYTQTLQPPAYSHARASTQGTERLSVNTSLARLWSAMSSPSTTYATVDEQATPSSSLPPSSNEPNRKRFIVTPVTTDFI